MKTYDSLGKNESFYAPCRRLTINAPFAWLNSGLQDFRRAPMHSITYGAIFSAIGWLLVYFSMTNQSFLLLGLFISVLVIGPALAFGLYDISQQLELNQTPSFNHERRKALHEMGHELMLALILSVVFMVMLLLFSSVIDIAVRPVQSYVTAAIPMADVHILYVAVVFAGLLYCANTFALPMILDRDTDAVTAITTSLSAVWQNKLVIALWALIVLVMTVIGFATALIGFVFIVPVLGYATWHAYRETILTS